MLPQAAAYFASYLVPEVAVYVVLAVLAVGLNWRFAREQRDAVGLAVMLVLACAITNQLLSTGTRPDNMRLLPAVDLACGLASLLAWRSQKTRWKALLVWSYGASLIAHVAFWAPYGLGPYFGFPETGSFDQQKAARNLYAFRLTILSYFTLAFVMWPGGSNGLASLRRFAVDHLPARLSGRGKVGPT